MASTAPTHPTDSPAIRPDHRRAFRYIDFAVVIAAIVACAGLLVANLAGEPTGPPSPAPAPTVPVTPIVGAAPSPESISPPMATPEVTPDQSTDTDPEVDSQVEPEPEPEPDPVDPQPQVPLGGNGDLAPNPTLPPPTCNGECVAPVDLHPIEQPVGRTPANIQLQGNDTAGCSVDCITRAQAFTDDDSTDVVIEVETQTLAEIKVWIDDEEPTLTNSGHPYFPGLQPFGQTSGDLDLAFTATATDLEEETRYWVLVIARDEQDRITEVVGTVVTPRIDDDVELAFTAIDVIYDGDKGRNKGELTFDWNVGYDEIGRNGEYTRGDGSRIDLSEQINSYARLDLGDGELPLLGVRGLETDPRGSLEFCSSSPDAGGSGTDNDCGYAWNSTLPATFTLADVSAMADCGVFDIADEYDDWKCTRIATVQSYGGIPEFSEVVAFRVF